MNMAVLSDNLKRLSEDELKISMRNGTAPAWMVGSELNRRESMKAEAAQSPHKAPSIIEQLSNSTQSLGVANTPPAMTAVSQLPSGALPQSMGMTSQPKRMAVGGMVGLLDRTEGAGSYDTLFHHSNREGGPFSGVTPSTMTMAQLDEFENSKYGPWSKDQLGYKATPAGRYQIVGSTRRGLMDQMGIPEDAVFDKDLQDKMRDRLLQDALATDNPKAALRATWSGLDNVSDAELDAALAQYQGGKAQESQMAQSPATPDQGGVASAMSPEQFLAYRDQFTSGDEADPWSALTKAGLAMMATRGDLGQKIGAGGLAGIAAYEADQDAIDASDAYDFQSYQDYIRDEEDYGLADRRLDISEEEVGLRRELIEINREADSKEDIRQKLNHNLNVRRMELEERTFSSEAEKSEYQNELLRMELEAAQIRMEQIQSGEVSIDPDVQRELLRGAADLEKAAAEAGTTPEVAQYMQDLADRMRKSAGFSLYEGGSSTGNEIIFDEDAGDLR